MKVRIPAMISASGKWCAYGYPEAETDPDWSIMFELSDVDGENEIYHRVWITVDLPIPEVAEVIGEVEK